MESKVFNNQIEYTLIKNSSLLMGSEGDLAIHFSKVPFPFSVIVNILLSGFPICSTCSCIHVIGVLAVPF
jgi:hypothetical protein